MYNTCLAKENPKKDPWLGQTTNKAMFDCDYKLQEQVKSRLQVKFPDHYYDDPYK
jgi:hypothetical protein